MSNPSPHANVQPADSDTPEFPCRAFPALARHARLLGVYPQRQVGRFMQRVRIPGGVLTAGQWRAMAEIARRFTPATPLHLTTRQDIEFHDLAEPDVPGVQRLIADAGLTSLGSGGDTLRNVIVCPCSAGGTADAPDLMPLAHALDRLLAAQEGIFALPRKFKISLGCDRGCGRPFTHDLAFVSVRRGSRWGLKVIAAGSLGPSPALGIVVEDWIEPVEAAAFCMAAVRVFARHGNRQNRSKARLRHVRERLGGETFLAMLRAEYRGGRDGISRPALELTSADRPLAGRRILAFPGGDVTPDQAQALAVVAEADDGAVRIGNDHRVHLFAENVSAIYALLESLPSLAVVRDQGINVVACPGTRWCSRALADTNNLAHRIRAALSTLPGTHVNIAVSGCPNGCASSAVAEIGILGGRSTAGSQSVDKYSVLIGGGNGATDVLARPLVKGLSADETLAKIVELAQMSRWKTAQR